MLLMQPSKRLLKKAADVETNNNLLRGSKQKGRDMRLDVYESGAWSAHG